MLNVEELARTLLLGSVRKLYGRSKGAVLHLTLSFLEFSAVPVATTLAELGFCLINQQHFWWEPYLNIVKGWVKRYLFKKL